MSTTKKSYKIVVKEKVDGETTKYSYLAKLTDEEVTLLKERFKNHRKTRKEDGAKLFFSYEMTYIKKVVTYHQLLKSLKGYEVYPPE